MKMNAPGRASSMKEKSSEPMVGGGVRIDMGIACDLARDARREVGLGRVIDGRADSRDGIPRAHVAPLASARPATISWIRFSTLSRVAGLSVRTVPLSHADCGMMLLAVPAWKRVIETTHESSGSTLRDVMVCKAVTICAPTTTGIDALMRQRPVAALAFDRDRDLIGRRHHRALAEAEGADRRAGPVVHAVDLLDAELIHQSVVDHRHRARAALLGGLEDDDGVAGEVAGLRKALRRAEQHRGMPVVAASVHLARDLGAIGEVGLLFDRQRVHIRAEPDRTRTRSLGAVDDADHAGAADRRFDLVAAEGAKPLSDKLGGLLDVVHEFGVLMDFRRQVRTSGTRSLMAERIGIGRRLLANSQQLTARRAAVNARAAQRLPVQEKNRLIAQQIPRPWRENPMQRLASEIERDALVDRRADLARQRHKVGDRAEMDVRRVVPGMGQAFGHRHPAREGDLGPDAPMAEIRHRNDGAPTNAQHVFEHDARLARRLQRLRQDDIVESVIRDNRRGRRRRRPE